ncbi:MAG TPA: DUF4232 domain-containing protein [Streptosporangiaceae bacterium]|nr:DUF4232 domain-containing protein [Streptosporangiaceae bacterium]
MNTTAPGTRLLLALLAVGPVAALATGCGTNAASTPGGTTTTVTIAPSSGGGQAGSSAPPASASTSPPPAGPSECTSSGLHVAVGQSNGAAGTIYYNLDFTNVSGAACFVQGYPGASLVSAGSGAGSQIGADAKRDPVTPSKQIVLGAGQTAHAVLGVAEAGNFPASKCNPVTAHWLKVFPPDQTVAAYASFDVMTCASTSVATMRITALSAGA